MSWELHTDKLNIHPYPPPPISVPCFCSCIYRTAVQLSRQPTSQPLSKATSVETEHTRAACRSPLVPEDRGSVSGLLATHYRWPHQPYHWVLIECHLLLCHLNELCEASDCCIFFSLSVTYSDLPLKLPVVTTVVKNKTRDCAAQKNWKATLHYCIH